MRSAGRPRRCTTASTDGRTCDALSLTVENEAAEPRRAACPPYCSRSG